MAEDWLTTLIDELAALKFAGDHAGADRAICRAVAALTGLTADTAMFMAGWFQPPSGAIAALRCFADLAKEK